MSARRRATASLARIGSLPGSAGTVGALDEAADALWAISASGRTRSSGWSSARPMLRPDGAGFKLHYDPAIAVPFRLISPEGTAPARPRAGV